jgi:hypothetical protein
MLANDVIGSRLNVGRFPSSVLEWFSPIDVVIFAPLTRPESGLRPDDSRLGLPTRNTAIVRHADESMARAVSWACR